MQSLKDGIGMARTLFGQSAFEDMVGNEVFPGKDEKEVRLVRCTHNPELPFRLLR